MPDSEKATGERLMDRYRILEELGRGSFGTTYAAIDEESGRRVAVKQLDLSRVDDWKAVELFEREARTLEQLDHPRIPDYVDFVPVQSEASGYLAQELAPGRSLQAILDQQGGFTDGQIEAIAKQVLELLKYLASLNPPVVHRDIKPANLILDDDENVYLVDFGAVQDVANRTEGGSTVAGTFGYMAPEQLHGQASPRSDLYALGMTLVHLTSGIDPSNLQRDGLTVQFEDVVDLPAELVDFIDRLVQPNPDDRFDGPEEALAFLDDNVPVSGSVRGLVGADDIEAMVRRRERQQRLAEQRRERQLERQAASMESRVSVVEDDSGFLMTVEPRNPPTRWLVAFGIATFLIINPGVFISLHFFAGSAWPFIDQATVAHTVWRWIIWAGFVLSGASWGAHRMRPKPVNLRITDENFMIYHDDPDQPDVVGRRSQLSMDATEHEDSAGGYLLLRVPDENYIETIDELSPDDLQLVQQTIEVESSDELQTW